MGSSKVVPKDHIWHILTDRTKSGTDEQREFVNKALQTKDFALLEGPPGSGKTTTIIELIIQFASEGKRILLCSATHAAIDNVLERIKGKFKDTCDKEVVPVRISRLDKPVKENVRPFLLKNLVSTYQSAIKENLKTHQEYQSQKFLYDNLNHKAKDIFTEYKQALIELFIGQEDQIAIIEKFKSKNELQTFISQKINQAEENIELVNALSDVSRKYSISVDPIEEIVLDSANLVCGTMIGILQHPDIKANKQGASFDILIVDEASKVTFSEFIVPAVHAEKWILVGDVKQLSPYVENDYVSENIGHLLDEETQQMIAQQFELRNRLSNVKFNDYLKIYFTIFDIDKEYESLKSIYQNLEIVKVTNSISENEILKINGADVLLCMNSGIVKSFLSKNIFFKSIVINGSFKSDLEFKYRQYYLHGVEVPEFSSKDEDWSELVASRLNQSFSFRHAEGFDDIDTELKILIPSKIEEDISRIKRLIFPSVLEMLQNGVGKRKEYDRPNVLATGFDPRYKENRFVSLSFQHRMHPDIARTSKENFYSNNLQPANTVLEQRNWSYALQEPVVKWLHDNDDTGNRKGERIINPTEVNNIERELLKFLEWAKDHPKVDEYGVKENYEVAVLTFYVNQETELRRRIRRITNQSFYSRFYQSNTDILLYTVDKFQGQEADLVLLGFTKFSRNAFYNSPNRLNVALTRARHKLILFGNKELMKRSKLKALRELSNNFESIITYKYDKS